MISRPSRFTAATASAVLASVLAVAQSAWAIAPYLPTSAAKPQARPASHEPKAKAVLQGYSPAAQRVLAQARAASGGAGWSLLRGWHETGHQGAARYESWFDTLRYGMRIETRDAAGLRVSGFNGQGAWQISPSGASSGVDDRALVAQARTEAFIGANGFLYPGRFDAHGEFLGVRRIRGKSFDVVSVHPWEGDPCELWFDRASHLLGRIIDQSGTQTVTIELSDYRSVGPIKVAFHVTIEGLSSAGVLDRRVDSVVFTPAEREMFSLPRPADL